MQPHTFSLRCLFLPPTLGIALALSSSVALADAVPVVADAQWYLHADLLEMRQTPSGQYLYAWLQDEVLEDIEDELGLDLAAELDGITVFGAKSPERDDAAVLLHGFLSGATRDALVTVASGQIGLAKEERFGRSYFRIGDSVARGADFEGGFLAFGDLGQTLVTGNETMLERFLQGEGHFAGAKGSRSNLITIQAEAAMLHGGMDAAGMSRSSGPWDSHLFRNVERLALVVDDSNGLMDIQVFVTAVDETMAQAIQNIIQGLLSLKVLDDGDPEAAALLQNLQVTSQGAEVRMQLVLEPETVLAILD